MKSFVLFVLLGSSVTTIEGSKCDPELEANILALCLDTMKSCIKTSMENGKEVVAATSGDYYPSDTSCVFSVMSKDSFTGCIIPTNSCAVISKHPLMDIPGGTYDPESKVKRLRVTNGYCGVQCFYECCVDGEEGSPKGMIKVAESSSMDYTPLIEECERVFCELGISITTYYNWTCPVTDEGYYGETPSLTSLDEGKCYFDLEQIEITTVAKALLPVFFYWR